MSNLVINIYLPRDNDALCGFGMSTVNVQRVGKVVLRLSVDGDEEMGKRFFFVL